MFSCCFILFFLNNYTHFKNLITNDEYIIDSLIGEGSFGKVYKIISKFNNSIFAMKIPIISNNFDKNKTKSILYLNNEITVLKKIGPYSGIVKLIDYEFDCYILMPYYKTTMLEFIKYDTNNYIKQNIINIFYKLLHTLKYIHTKGIIYQDLKPENIMLDNNDLILIDFGNSIITTDINYTNNELAGTLQYCSIKSHTKCPITILDYVCIFLYEQQLPWNINNSSQYIQNINDWTLNLKLKYRNECLQYNKTSLTTNNFLSKLYQFICTKQMLNKKYHNKYIKSDYDLDIYTEIIKLN